MQPTYLAGYLVDDKAGIEPAYLLLQRSKASYLPGIWQMVTGKLKAGETAQDAVYREIYEETGLTVERLYNVDVTMFYEQLKNKIAFSANFCAFVNSENAVILSESEHSAYKWCTFSKALSLLAFPSQKETLSFIHRWFVLEQPGLANMVKK